MDLIQRHGSTSKVEGQGMLRVWVCPAPPGHLHSLHFFTKKRLEYVRLFRFEHGQGTATYRQI
ncbi:hypothetical protein PPUJ13061_57160 [Pseudomonas putida]|nr:hypothetical protein PPUJ13061_57160 [Pseudomonas putida]